MTYLDNVVEFHVNMIFPSICIEKLCITIFFIDENVRLLLFQRIISFYFFFVLQLITSMTGGSTLNRRNTISVGEDPSMVSGQSLMLCHLMP